MNRSMLDLQNTETRRLPGVSRRVITIDRPSEFDEKFGEFIKSMGAFKIVGINFKTDDPPEGGKGKSKSAKAAARRRRKRMMMRQLRYGNAVQSAAPHLDAGDNGTWTCNDGQAGTEPNVDEEDENEDMMSDEDEDRELTEEEICEFARQKSYELGKIALISISSLNGETLLIRSCRFVKLPEQLSKMLEGKEFLKIGFGIQGDKDRMYEKYGFFVLNYVDPRRPLITWKDFVDGYHFERFGVYSVASYLFKTEMLNVDAAACLSSMWSAPELNPYLKRAAARETQLTIDVYAEMCVRMMGQRNSGFSLAASVCDDPTFLSDLMKVAEGHVNNGFNMKDFGTKVFGMPALQRRFNLKSSGGKLASGAAMTSDAVPETFADRVRLRQSKSSIKNCWKSRVLYAAFDISLFSSGSTQPVMLSRKIENVQWDMKIEVLSKVGNRTSILRPPEATMPAVAFYAKEESEMPAAANLVEEVEDEEPENENIGGEVNGCEYTDAVGIEQQQAELVNFVGEVSGLYAQCEVPQYSPVTEPVVGLDYGAPLITKGRGRLNLEETEVVPIVPRGRGRAKPIGLGELSYFAQQTMEFKSIGPMGHGRGRPIAGAVASGWNGDLPKSRGPQKLCESENDESR